MTLTVVTYGGGEILQHIFNAIAMLINGGSNGIIRPMLMLSATIGGFWAFSKALIFPSYEKIFSNFLFPSLCVSFCLFIPTTSIRIEDIIKHTSYKVDHVPLLLARFAEMVSSLGYRVTEAVETVMHVPQDLRYNATGMVFGSDTALNAAKYQITNGILEQDLKQFSKQCVLYDVALDRYSIDDLKKSSDLWRLFEEKTSKTRMINYCDPNGKEKCRYLTCQEVVKKMKPFFEKEKDYYAGWDIIANLPLTFQALTGLQRDKKDLIGQQLMMSLLASEFNPNKFAQARADAQNQSTMHLMGSLASSTLLSMRNIIEAFIYIGFVFVLPLSLLPTGFRILANWAWCLVWIQTWPPLYAALSYIIQIIARSKSNAIFTGLASDQIGLSFFTNVGMHQLQDQMVALTGLLCASVPVLSHMLLKGGMHAISNLTGSLIAPMQNAATTAAAEQATGNYSFANASFGQVSYQNASGFQNNLAPSISDGFFTDHQGNSTKIYSPDGNILQQNSSRLLTSMSINQLDSQALQRCEQESQSLVDTKQKTFLESLSNHGKMTADLTMHFANSKNYNEGFSAKEGYGLQESASYLQNIAENWGKQYGFSAKESMEGLMSASVGGKVGFTDWLSANLTGSGNYHLGASKDEIANSAITVATNSSFQSHLQKINDVATSKSFSEVQDEGARMVTAYGESLDDLRSSQMSHQAALSKLQQVSDNASWLRQNSSSINQSLDQVFVEWAQGEFGGLEQVDEILSKGSLDQRQDLIMKFMEDFRPNPIGILSVPDNLDAAYQNTQITKLNNKVEQSHIEDRVVDILTKSGESSDLMKWNMNKQKEALAVQGSSYKDRYEDEAQSLSSQINTRREEAAQQFDDKNKEYLIGSALRHLKTQDNLSSKYRIVEKPFWMED